MRREEEIIAYLKTGFDFVNGVEAAAMIGVASGTRSIELIQNAQVGCIAFEASTGGKSKRLYLKDDIESISTKRVKPITKMSDDEIARMIELGVSELQARKEEKEEGNNG